MCDDVAHKVFDKKYKHVDDALKLFQAYNKCDVLYISLITEYGNVGEASKFL